MSLSQSFGHLTDYHLFLRRFPEYQYFFDNRFWSGGPVYATISGCQTKSLEIRPNVSRRPEHGTPLAIGGETQGRRDADLNRAARSILPFDTPLIPNLRHLSFADNLDDITNPAKLGSGDKGSARTASSLLLSTTLDHISASLSSFIIHLLIKNSTRWLATVLFLTHPTTLRFSPVTRHRPAQWTKSRRKQRVAAM